MSLLGRIYKIIDTQSNTCYVGSTFNSTRDRFMKHKRSFREWENGKYPEVSIFPYFKKFGLDRFKMILIKEYQVCDRAHLECYEQLWINKLKPINKYNPFRIDRYAAKQYREEHKAEDGAQYYENNKESVLKRCKEYRKENKDIIREKSIEYRSKHKEQIQQRSAQYYKNNAEQAAIKNAEYYKNNKSLVREKEKIKRANAPNVSCACGSSIAKHNERKHLKTKKHTNWLANQ